MNRRYLAVSVLVAVLSIGPTAQSQTLTAMDAQSSPQADVFLAYEHALLWQGVDAAGMYMTPERLADMQEMIRQFGEDEFREFQARQRESTAQGDERRGQIESVAIDGDTAILTARSGPNFVDEVPLAKTADGWKIATGR